LIIFPEEFEINSYTAFNSSNPQSTENLLDKGYSLFDFSSPLCVYTPCMFPYETFNIENLGNATELKDINIETQVPPIDLTKPLNTTSTDKANLSPVKSEISIVEEKIRSGIVSGIRKISTQEVNPRKRLNPEKTSEPQAKPRRKLKKTRLEKNRISAREFRLKRKAYITSLEGQVDTLHEQLLKYQKELNHYKLKEQEDLLAQMDKQEESTEDLSCPIGGMKDIADRSFNNYMV